MRKTRKKVVRVLLALSMVVLALAGYISPMKKAQAATDTRGIDKLADVAMDANNQQYPIWVAGTQINTTNSGGVLLDSSDQSIITFEETEE